jgi:hypothetical protein
MKRWIANAALAATLGLGLAGCGEKAPKVSWKEADGSVVKAVKLSNGTCISDIKYDTAKGPMTTSFLGAGEPLPVGRTVKLKYDEENPGSVKFLDGTK